MAHGFTADRLTSWFAHSGTAFNRRRMIIHSSDIKGLVVRDFMSRDIVNTRGALGKILRPDLKLLIINTDITHLVHAGMINSPYDSPGVMIPIYNMFQQMTPDLFKLAVENNAIIVYNTLLSESESADVSDAIMATYVTKQAIPLPSRLFQYVPPDSLAGSPDIATPASPLQAHQPKVRLPITARLAFPTKDTAPAPELAPVTAPAPINSIGQHTHTEVSGTGAAASKSSIIWLPKLKSSRSATPLIYIDRCGTRTVSRTTPTPTVIADIVAMDTELHSASISEKHPTPSIDLADLDSCQPDMPHQPDEVSDDGDDFATKLASASASAPAPAPEPELASAPEPEPASAPAHAPATTSSADTYAMMASIESHPRIAGSSAETGSRLDTRQPLSDGPAPDYISLANYQCSPLGPSFAGKSYRYFDERNTQPPRKSGAQNTYYTPKEAYYASGSKYMVARSRQIPHYVDPDDPVRNARNLRRDRYELNRADLRDFEHDRRRRCYNTE
jgi:hypothetical protein